SLIVTGNTVRDAGLDALRFGRLSTAPIFGDIQITNNYLHGNHDYVARNMSGNREFGSITFEGNTVVGNGLAAAQDGLYLGYELSTGLYSVENNKFIGLE